MAEGKYKISIDIDEKKISSKIGNAFKKGSDDFLKNTKSGNDFSNFISSQGGSNKLKTLPQIKGSIKKNESFPFRDFSKKEMLDEKSPEKQKKILEKEEEKRSKYIFNETKKQLKRTNDFEKARSIALKKSKQTDEERRKLDLSEYSKDLAIRKKQKDSKSSYFNKTLGEIAKNTKLSKITLGNFLGSLGATAVSGAGSFLLSSIKRNTELGKSKSQTSAIYGLQEKDLRKNVFSKYSTAESGNYINAEKQQEILNRGGGLKSTLTNLGQSDKLEKYLKQVARLVSSGEEVTRSFDLIESALKGNFSELISEAQKYGTAYNAESARVLGMSGINVNDRLEHIDKILQDIKAETISTNIGLSPEIKSARAAEVAIDAVTKGVNSITQKFTPAVDKFAKIIDKIFSADSLTTVVSDAGKSFASYLKDAFTPSSFKNFLDATIKKDEDADRP